MADVRGKNAPVGSHFAGPIKLGAKSMVLSTDFGGISGTKTLTAEESNGQTYVITAVGGGSITLPAPTQGWKCKFILGADITTNWAIGSPSVGQMQGSIMVAGAVVVSAADQFHIFVNSADSIGDYLEYSSDGTSIFVFGNAALTGGITSA